MKILFLQKRMDALGGSEIQSIKLAKSFSRSSNIVYFWYSNIDFNLYPDLKSSSKVINSIQSYTGLIWPLSLLRKIKKLKPDIVYTRDFRRLSIYAFICKFLQFPLVYNVNHDVSKVPYKINQLFGTIYEYLRKYDFFPVWAFFAYLSVNIYPYLSKVITQTKEQEIFLKSKKIDSLTIPNGFKVPKNSIYKKEKKPLIVWLGSLKKRIKRPHLFLEISKICNNWDIDFKFCGRLTDDKIYNKYLMNEVGNLKNVEYLGELDATQVDVLLKSSFLLINTSRLESFPNTFVEAWIRGVPVISLSVDPDKIISNKGLGFVVGSSAEAAKKINYLINDSNYYKNICQASKEYALAHFDESVISKKYLSLFNKLCQTSNSSSN